MVPARLIREINAKIETKVKSVKRRTANCTREHLQLRLAMAELNHDNALDQRDYLMSTEWQPMADELGAELKEAIRLSHRLDLMNQKRVEEILSYLLYKLGDKLKVEQENVA